MKIFTPSTLAWVFGILSLAVLPVPRSEAQTSSTKTSDRIMRERIAVIFQETLKSGEFRIEYKGQQVTGRTFMPPSVEHTDEIRRYGDQAIPILTDYLNGGSGFEKYLAMRFLGFIGGKGIIDPLRRVALDDPEPSFRIAAILSLSASPWDLAAPIITQAAEKDSSDEVRTQAKAILAQHQKHKAQR